MAAEISTRKASPHVIKVWAFYFAKLFKINVPLFEAELTVVVKLKKAVTGGHTMVKVNKVLKQDYTVIPNELVKDARLSLKARGVFLYIYAQADSWDFYELEVVRHATDGRDSLRTALAELETFGYLRRSRIRNENGQLGPALWEIAASPIFANTPPMSDTPTTVTPTLPAPTPVQAMQAVGPLIKTNELSTNITKPKEIINNKTIPITEIIDYLNIQAKQTFKATKSTTMLITTRYQEGFDFADFKHVIDVKCTDWLHDPQWAKYLRPSTLFGPKFEQYRNQPIVKNTPQLTENGAIWYE